MQYNYKLTYIDSEIIYRQFDIAIDNNILKVKILVSVAIIKRQISEK